MAGEDDAKVLALALDSLKDVPDVDTFIARCPGPPDLGDPPTILLYPRFKEDAPDISAFAEWLWINAINYAIPLRKRKLAQQTAGAGPSGADLASTARLYLEAKRAFLNFNKAYPSRASEVGELIAYLVALRFLNAGQLASKMALKTNTNMPIHGLDGVHASFENGVMTLYFLESKLAKTAASGAKEYAESVKGFGNSRKQYLVEYEILSDLGNLQALSDEQKLLAMEYLDIYGKKKSQRIERSIGVICFTEGNHYSNKLQKNKATPPAAHEKNFSSIYEADHARHLAAVKKYLDEKDVKSDECEVFFVAVPDVNVLRELFQEHMK
ncbi:MAG: DUF1837 domain-containing protein [Pseudomonadota bacterium]